MINEDAIKWLENLKNDIGNPHYECLWHYAQAIDEICAMLEEQEAVEPIRHYARYSKKPYGMEFWYNCGSCKAEILETDKFCHECGRAVKWE